jgi:hypothetical protein
VEHGSPAMRSAERSSNMPSAAMLRSAKLRGCAAPVIARPVIDRVVGLSLNERAHARARGLIRII